MSNAQQQAAYQQAYQQYQQAQAQYQQQQQQQPSTTQYNQKFKSTLCNVWLMEGVCPRGRFQGAELQVSSPFIITINQTTTNQ
jgi:hypothetical protein